MFYIPSWNLNWASLKRNIKSWSLFIVYKKIAHFPEHFHCLVYYMDCMYYILAWISFQCSYRLVNEVSTVANVPGSNPRNIKVYTSLNSTTPVIVLPNVTFALDSRVIALLQCTYYIDNINSLKIIETRILEPGVVMQ